MSLDSFFGLDDPQGGLSPEKVREFQERMRKNAAQMAAARKQEAKQKKKEDRLAAILLKFIQQNKKQDIVLLVARCLEQNIPPVFVLSVILLGNEDIQEEVGVNFALEGRIQEEDVNESSAAPTGAVVAFGSDNSIPLKMKIAIDLWGKNVFSAASPLPERILKTACEFNEDASAEPAPKEVLNQLTAFILRDYFKENGEEAAYENVRAFAEFFMKGIMVRLKEQLADQKELSGEVEE